METQNSDQMLVNDLHLLAEEIQPDVQFITTLDAQIRRTARQTTHSNRANRMRVNTVIAALLIGVFFGIWTVPSLRVVALQVLESLFNHSDGDTHVFTYNSADSVTQIPMAKTVDEAQAIVRFRIYAPKAIPSAYQLKDITANPSEIYFEYTFPGRYLTISQQLNSAAWQMNGLIGANAKIVNVDIDGIDGEYVEGNWIVSGASPIPEQKGLLTQVADWRSDVSTRRLRWQNGQVLYEIVAYGGSSDIPHTYVDMSEMIAIAKSLR